MQLTYENDDFSVNVDGKTYVCGVTALGDYSYDPGRMYYPDGTGCPPDEYLEIISVSVDNICEEETETPVIDSGLTAKICDAVDDTLYELDLDAWSGWEEEDPEPEYE